MIRFACPTCGVKLSAKEKLAGQSRTCPKCGTTIEIPRQDALAEEDNGLDDVVGDQRVIHEDEHDLPPVATPERLVHSNRYWICDKSRVVALWEGDARGWMLRAGAGLAPAKRSPEDIPTEGNFVMVELIMAATDEGHRLRGIRCHELPKRYALMALAQDEHKILSKVTGPGRLAKEQKAAVLTFLRDHLMRSTWEDAREVLGFLSNQDYHSPGVE
ncbi:MAG: hypothetical protein ACYTG0_33250 [Planctomycetota bacterium]|jgi:hypothetical protein